MEQALLAAAKPFRHVGPAGDDVVERAEHRLLRAGFSSRKRSPSVNWKTSITSPFGLVSAWPRRMSIPNDDSIPQMFENRNGLSCVTTVSSQVSSLRSREQVQLVGAHVPRQPDMPVNRIAIEQLEVATRKAFQHAADLGLGEIRRGDSRRAPRHRLAAIDQVVAVAEGQLVVRVDVESPQELLLPGRQGLEAHGLDVGERQQAQHLQPILPADELRELTDDLRVLGIATEGDLGHPEMTGDEELDELRGLGVELEGLEHLPRHANALGGVVLVAPLADVVQQQREDEQLRRLQIPEERRKALAPLVRHREPLEISDRQQRVLVDRVLVVEVAHHAVRDRLELGGSRRPSTPQSCISDSRA